MTPKKAGKTEEGCLGHSVFWNVHHFPAPGGLHDSDRFVASSGAAAPRGSRIYSSALKGTGGVNKQRTTLLTHPVYCRYDADSAPGGFTQITVSISDLMTFLMVETAFNNLDVGTLYLFSCFWTRGTCGGIIAAGNPLDSAVTSDNGIQLLSKPALTSFPTPGMLVRGRSGKLQQSAWRNSARPWPMFAGSLRWRSQARHEREVVRG